MDSPDFSPPQVNESRPTFGFPLGTALLLIIIFGLSGIFSCCYHWDKLRSLRWSHHRDPEEDIEASSLRKSKSSETDLKQNQGQSMPVLMPGDQIPRFIALPCPCEPLKAEKVCPKDTKPPKPPPFPVPLY